MNEFQSLETEIGTSIPASLKDYFQHPPALDAVKNKFIRVVDGDFQQENIVTKFWSRDEVIQAWNNMKNESMFAEEKILPVAETLGSAVVCIGIGEANKGEIFVFDYDFFNTKVADSMGDFLNMLY